MLKSIPSFQAAVWFIRLAALIYLLDALLPAPPRAPLQTPQVVQTQHASVCVHTRLIDEVYEWKIQRSLQRVREMGATTIVEFFPWAYAEPAPGQYNWTSFDQIIRHARNQGLHIIARMGLVPDWARPSNGEFQTTLNDLPEESFDDFATFVAAFAQRYAGVVDDIIIWNEPNLSFEWGYRPVDPLAYTRLLQAVYQPVHEANPAVNIVAAPLAPTLEPEGSPNGLNDLLYLDAMLTGGAANFFDVLGIHTYGFTEPPEAEPGFDQLNFRRAELLHAILENHDAGDKPVYITESGWNDHPRWTKAVRPSQRIAYTINAFKWADDNWPWLDKLCIWVLRYPASTRSYPDNFTLLTPDFMPLPIYTAIQAYARGWSLEDDLWLPAPQ